MNSPNLQFRPTPVTLENDVVILEPLAERHAVDLFAAGADPSIWEYKPRPVLRDLEDTLGWIRETMSLQTAGEVIAFAIIARAAGLAVGSTRYLDIRPDHRALEIGWTWLGTRYQRTGINTACKLLLLEHAFDTLGAIRVQFKTDLRNERSQRALERIGARREGVLRRHVILWNGYIRDSVYYSVTDLEWPGVAARLRALQAAQQSNT